MSFKLYCLPKYALNSLFCLLIIICSYKNTLGAAETPAKSDRENLGYGESVKSVYITKDLVSIYTQFDKFGNNILREYRDGSYQSFQSTLFNSNNRRQIVERTYNQSYSRYRYNDKGLLTEVNVYPNTPNFYYDEHGKKKSTYNDEQIDIDFNKYISRGEIKLKYKIMFKYNKDNKIKKKIYRDRDLFGFETNYLFKDSTISYTYNKKGQIVKELERFYKDTSKPRKISTQYSYDIDGNLKSKTSTSYHRFFLSKKLEYKIYQYDDSSRLTKTFRYDEDYNKFYFNQWKYSKIGELLEDCYYMIEVDDDKRVSIDRYTQEFSRYRYNSLGEIIDADRCYLTLKSGLKLPESISDIDYNDFEINKYGSKNTYQYEYFSN